MNLTLEDSVNESIGGEKQDLRNLSATREISKCEHCDEEFGSITTLKNHVKREHKKNTRGHKTSELNSHMEKEHEKTQSLLDLNMDMTTKPPPAKRVVIFQVAGQLYWPAVVISENSSTITVRIFNKRRVLKTVDKEFVQDFDFEEHKWHISSKNSEHKHAFNEAKKLTGA